MEITLKSTDKIVQINNVPARVWVGTSKGGARCHAFITRIAVDKEQSPELIADFEKELQSHEPPSAEVRSIPLRMII